MSEPVDAGRQRYARLKEVVLAALECPEAELEAFLDRACAGDEVLRREVDSLLRHRVPV